MIKKILRGIIPAAIIATLSVVLFIGCQSQATTSQTATNGRGFNSANMKQRFADAIKPLVTDKTITQAQSDKIIAAITANIGGAGTGQRGTAGGNNSAGGNKTAGGNRASGNSTTGKNSGTNGQSPRTGSGFAGGAQSTQLAQLVKEGVITQAQSDAVSEKLKTAFSRPQGGGNNNDNSNTNTNADANSQNDQPVNQ